MDTECIAVIREYPATDSSPSTYTLNVFRRGAQVELQFEDAHSTVSAVVPWKALWALRDALEEAATKAGYCREQKQAEART